MGYLLTFIAGGVTSISLLALIAVIVSSIEEKPDPWHRENRENWKKI